MTLKKMTALFVALVAAFNLAACGGASAPAASQPQPAEFSSASAAPAKTAPANPVIRLSTTTSVNDSGLLPYLQPQFEADTGYKLEITSAGTGAALEKARTGDADALLVHAKASEEEFIGEGFAKERFPFMYNFFVIVGPADDPAGIGSSATASEAFKKIADKGYTFISRGDESGTHKAELKIWESAGLSPVSGTDSWYVSAGQGMGACINIASEQQAYLLTDKGTYLSHDKKDTLKLLLEKSDEMKNTYSMLAVSPEKWADTNLDGANAFIEWMRSDKTAGLINAYGVEEYGEQLFFSLDESE